MVWSVHVIRVLNAALTREVYSCSSCNSCIPNNLSLHLSPCANDSLSLSSGCNRSQLVLHLEWLQQIAHPERSRSSRISSDLNESRMSSALAVRASPVILTDHAFRALAQFAQLRSARAAKRCPTQLKLRSIVVQRYPAQLKRSSTSSNAAQQRGSARSGAAQAQLKR